MKRIIEINGKKYKADIRLKGDWIDHLTGDKWSFRIKLKGDKTIQGMKKFSIHHPITRGFINEWIYQKTNKKHDFKTASGFQPFFSPSLLQWKSPGLGRS